jgi:hypothetical protein
VDVKVCLKEVRELILNKVNRQKLCNISRQLSFIQDSAFF